VPDKFWEYQKAVDWANVLRKQKVASVEPTSWPCVCAECRGENSGACWKCFGTGESAREPAIEITFSNGAKLMIRSEYAAALFIKKRE
jgi:hypothetical protein